MRTIRNSDMTEFPRASNNIAIMPGTRIRRVPRHMVESCARHSTRSGAPRSAQVGMRMRYWYIAIVATSAPTATCNNSRPIQQIVQEGKRMRPSMVFVGLWLGFALSWIVAAFWSSRPARAVGMLAELPMRLVLVLGGVLLAIPAHGYSGPLRLWFPSHILALVCIALMIAGFAFAWWARIVMGAMWSGRITRKADHHLIDRGPFAIVRHPIYTGILLAVIATMLVKGTVSGVAGAVVVTLGLWMKARMEETWLGQELGVDIYADYRRRVSMLVPFAPKG
jgi:protein-S-isoprenylcysteine O-methyltransferase Ste14